MITLRLFKAADPFRQIESRPLPSGEITIGRDASAAWRIEDARGDLSRRHCTLGADGDQVWLRDTSTNGVYIGLDRRRAARDETIRLKPGDTVYLGEYMILLDPDPVDGEAELADRPPPVPEPAPPRIDTQRASAITDAGMLEAFCRGAGLEASSFAGEDPAALMTRLGVVYRQVIDDLCALMSDRALLKDSLKLDRTTISARDNNPLKWAPPHRVAADLLREGETGFLKGAAAFQSSFEDLRRHGACMLAGSRAAIGMVLDELRPEQIDSAAKRQPLDFLSRHDAAWRQFQTRHAALLAQAGGDLGGEIEQAFRRGYEVQLRALEARENAA